MTIACPNCRSNSGVVDVRTRENEAHRHRRCSQCGTKFVAVEYIPVDAAGEFLPTFRKYKATRLGFGSKTLLSETIASLDALVDRLKTVDTDSGVQP